MIDCDVKFGAFVPTVPQIYKDAASDSNSDNFQQKLDKASECYIGPLWTALKVRSIEPYNHDTCTFEFELPDPKARLCLPVTAHFLVKAPAGSEEDEDAVHVRPYTAVEEEHTGRFKIMVKLYREWGVPEAKLKEQNRVFLFAKTDHSYKPPGKVSNYIHSLRVGQSLAFKHNSLCLGKIAFPFKQDVNSITMIAVGAGVAPMIRILRALLDGDGSAGNANTNTNDQCKHVKTVRLLYGARTVGDILQREQLDAWHESYGPRFKVCYCIGSRWNNVHFSAKTSAASGPPLPVGWDSIESDRKELGWVDGDKVARRGASSAQDDGHRVFICGLPGVYLSLVGPRSDPRVEDGTQLHRLGYRDHQVVKF